MARPVPGGPEAPFTGGCLCGAVRYEATGPTKHASICHCSMCRKAAGAPFMAFFTVEPGHFRLTAGPLKHYTSSAKARRGFCGDCGTALTYENVSLPEIDIAAATLDEPERMPPGDQIYVADAISWVNGLPALPAYTQERTG